jgi:selenocysteine lyase/cysteine desulfurase
MYGIKGIKSLANLNKLVIYAPVLRLASTNASNNATKTSTDKYQELKKLSTRPLYLDSQATTPVDPRVLDAMLPYMTNMYGNPHSRTHAYGWESEKAVENAREVNKLAFNMNSNPF